MKYYIIIPVSILIGVFIAMWVSFQWGLTQEINLNLNENFEKCKNLGGEYRLIHDFKNGDHYELCEIGEIIRF